MSSASGIRAGRAYVELFADDSKLVRGLRNAGKRLESWGKGISGLGTKVAAAGAAVVTPMMAAAKAAANSGAEMYDLSRRTGITVEALSALGYAADMSGTDMATVEGAIRRMSKSIMGIADEAEGTTGKLDQIGLKFEDLKNLSPDKQFELIAGKIAEIKNPTQRAAAAMSIFGRSGTAIIPMIEDFAELNAEAESLGFIKSSESAKNAKELANTMTILGKAMKSVATAIGSAVMPVIRPYLQQVIGAAVQARDWLKANQPLIQTIFRIGAAVMAAGTALVALGYAVSYIGKGFGLLATVVPVIGTALSVVTTVIGFLLTPIGAVIGAVAALAGYWAYSSGAMGEAAGWLGEVFDGLRKDALTAFGGVTDALAAGDFGLAAQIAWTQIRLWWEKGTGWISGIWNDAMGWLTQRFYEAVGGWRIIFEEIGHGLTVAWLNITAGLSEVWYKFVYGIQVAWNWCGKMLQKAWNTIKGVFDKSFDSEAANKAAEDAYQNKIGELKKEKDGKIAAVEDQYNKEMASEKRLNQDNLQKIVDQTEAAKAADQAQRDAKDAANQKAVDQLTAERDGLVKKAKEKRTQEELDDGRMNRKPGDVKDPRDYTSRTSTLRA